MPQRIVREEMLYGVKFRYICRTWNQLECAKRVEGLSGEDGAHRQSECGGRIINHTGDYIGFPNPRKTAKRGDRVERCVVNALGGSFVIPMCTGR